MFERFMAFLDQIRISSPAPQQAIDQMQLSVAALMFAVMDADGVRHEAETQALQDLMSQKFDLYGHSLSQLIAAAEVAEAESVGLYQFTSVVKRLEEQERIYLVELMWELVFADGELHEMEDHVVWSIADLLGVSQRDRVELRRKVKDASFQQIK